MDKNQKYNGWKNWETWVVNLWITNDEQHYNYFMKKAGKGLEELKSSILSRLNIIKDLDKEDRKYIKNNPSIIDWQEIYEGLIE